MIPIKDDLVKTLTKALILTVLKLFKSLKTAINDVKHSRLEQGFVNKKSVKCILDYSQERWSSQTAISRRPR